MGKIDMEKSTDNIFGGEWTQKKLQVLEEYLERYNTALKNQPFRRIYIDAFAGTGYTSIPKRGKNSKRTQSIPPLIQLFDSKMQQDSEKLLEGSARIALQTEIPFDEYFFIEKDTMFAEKLKELKSDFPNQKITILNGDANDEIIKICQSEFYSGTRAVVFLDPYGMSLNFNTLRALARTKATDVLNLVPLGIAINRLLTKSGEIPEAWRLRLNEILGTDDWYSELYQSKNQIDLFGQVQESFVKKSIEHIGQYYIDRLKGIFAGVVEKPGILKNSTNNHMYLLCFAAANPKGSDVAIPIATSLLKKLS